MRRVCASFLILLLTVTLAPSASAATIKDATSVSGLSCYGASARAPGKQPCSNPSLRGPYPAISDAAADGGINRELCGTMSRADALPKVCVLGVKSAPVKVGMIGDSHIGPWVGAVSALAATNNWRVELYWKGGCPFSDAQRVHDAVLTKTCKSYNTDARRRILAAHYDVLITTQVSGVEWMPTGGATSSETAENGLVSLWSAITKSGTSVVVIKDNPRPIPKVLTCLKTRGLTKCNAKRATAFLHDPQVAAVQRLASKRVVLANFDNVFCDPTTCSPVIGNVIVYRDANHLTSTFTKSLGPFLLPYIRKALLN
jgi:hypothetical protein